LTMQILRLWCNGAKTQLLHHPGCANVPGAREHKTASFMHGAKPLTSFHNCRHLTSLDERRTTNRENLQSHSIEQQVACEVRSSRFFVRALDLPAKCLWHSVKFHTETSDTSLLHLCPLSVLSDRAVTQSPLGKVRANGTCVCRMIYCLHFCRNMLFMTISLSCVFRSL
jgi:hypothetical protein